MHALPLSLMIGALFLSSCELPRRSTTNTTGSVRTVEFRHKDNAVTASEAEVPAEKEISEPNNRVVTLISTLGSGFVAHPTMSSDGTKVAFASRNDSGFWNIRVVMLGQQGVQEVTRGNWIDIWPRFAGDSSALFFCSNRLGDGHGICRIATAGIGGIGSVIPGRGIDAPDVGPKGRLIFSTSRQGFTPQIWTTEGDGGFLTQLGEGYQPRWSPDGSQIVFVRRDRTTDLGHIWVMRTDGSNERKMTDGDGDDIDPCWSPDGKMIAFASTRGQKVRNAYDIYTIDADGNSLTQITSNLSFDRHPMFGPDPSQLYFLSSRNLQLSIWRVSLK